MAESIEIVSAKLKELTDKTEKIIRKRNLTNYFKIAIENLFYTMLICTFFSLLLTDKISFLILCFFTLTTLTIYIILRNKYTTLHQQCIDRNKDCQELLKHYNRLSNQLIKETEFKIIGLKLQFALAKHNNQPGTIKKTSSGKTN